MGIEEKTEEAIKLVANPYPSEGHPVEIWSNTVMDARRRKECLCYNCGHKDDQPIYSGCPAAAELYALAKKYDMAMIITRCGATDSEGNILYKPL